MAGGLGIAGTLLGVLCTYRLSITLAERQFLYAREIAKVESRHVATRELIEAFANDIRHLENEATEDTDAMHFLRAAFLRHSAAIAKFEHFLPPERRRMFLEKWQEHCYGFDSSGLADSPSGVGIKHISLLYLHYGYEYNLAEPTAPFASAAKAIRVILSYGET